MGPVLSNGFSACQIIFGNASPMAAFVALSSRWSTPRCSTMRRWWTLSSNSDSSKVIPNVWSLLLKPHASLCEREGGEGKRGNESERGRVWEERLESEGKRELRKEGVKEERRERGKKQVINRSSTKALKCQQAGVVCVSSAAQCQAGVVCVSSAAQCQARGARMRVTSEEDLTAVTTSSILTGNSDPTTVM